MISFFQKMAADSKSMIMLALGTCLFYFLVLIPLDKKVQALNTPLQLSWTRLGDSINTNKLGGALDIHAMNELTSSMESTFASFTDAEANLISRVLLPEETQAKMEQSFQLVEYENALVALEVFLKKSAAEKTISVGDEVFKGLPRHDVAVEEPRLLWAGLAFANYLLSLAIECQLDSILRFESLPPQLTEDASISKRNRLHRSRFSMSVQCDMAEAQQFLAALPLRGDEAESLELPMVHPEKPALYIERLLLKKTPKGSANQVMLDLVVNGFTYHEIKERSGIE